MSAEKPNKPERIEFKDLLLSEDELTIVSGGGDDDSTGDYSDPEPWGWEPPIDDEPGAGDWPPR